MLSEIGNRLKGILDTRMKTGEAAPAAGSDEAKLEDFIRGTSGLIRLHLGSNFIDAEEVADGEAHLKAAVEILEPLKADSRYSIACIKIQNTLGVLWCVRIFTFFLSLSLYTVRQHLSFPVLSCPFLSCPVLSFLALCVLTHLYLAPTPPPTQSLKKGKPGGPRKVLELS